MADGVLIVNKPAGMTSFDVIAKLRKLYGTRQIGHTGTLDPMATGVLCVLIGRAVKASEYAMEHDKTYIAGLKLGITTDTEDITGTVLTHTDRLPEEAAVRETVLSFLGDGMQIPPMYSALKVEGSKLCDLARRGESVEREARPIHIGEIFCEAVHPETGDYRLTVSCSKGTYIRTLCADIGARLGCGGVMSSLCRTRVGQFSVEDSHTLPEIEALVPEEREGLLADTECLFTGLPVVRLPSFFAGLASCGNEIYLKKIGCDYPLGQRVRLYDSSFFSLGEVREYPEGPAVKPVKKFRLD